ncbi:hypothetical protein KQX54_014700 [Cotesia glomerata]|uniref:Uncharacterized protein n=1 Tax=Cotesia glomerata TaxID=32391 RepID=A0AAV7IMI6_COTGL|nr:hypothetical protein KQX54_014700 [Cotesia glomerata]
MEKYNQWPLAIEIRNEPSIYLNLHKVDNIATKNTPIYFGNNNGTVDCTTTYEKFRIDTIFDNLREVVMFQDYDNKAAITIFWHGENNVILEGFIGNYILRQTEDKNYFLLKVTYPIDEFENDEYKKYKKNDRFAKHNLSSPEEEIIVKVLVALDWTSAQQEVAQVVSSLLVYYNAVNMLFQPFTSPKIKVAVSGIIYPNTEFSTPYFSNSKTQFPGYDETYIKLNSANENFRKHFLNEEAKVFPNSLFDVIIGMTGQPICDADYNCQYYGVSDQSVIYNRGKNAEKNDPIPIVGVVRHPSFQGNYAVVAREIAHILGSSYNTRWYAFNNCNGIMNKFVRPDNWPLDWSACNIDDMSLYFRYLISL